MSLRKLAWQKLSTLDLECIRDLEMRKPGKLDMLRMEFLENNAIMITRDTTRCFSYHNKIEFPDPCGCHQCMMEYIRPKLQWGHIDEEVVKIMIWSIWGNTCDYYDPDAEPDLPRWLY